jgi:hypothetical protein
LRPIVATEVSSLEAPPDKKRRGGGGAQRDFIRNFLMNKPGGKTPEERSQLLREANEAYRAQKEAGGADHDASLRRGAAATASHKAGPAAPGFSSFGSQPWRRTKAEQQEISEAVLAVSRLVGGPESIGEGAVADGNHLAVVPSGISVTAIDGMVVAR